MEFKSLSFLYQDIRTPLKTALKLANSSVNLKLSELLHLKFKLLGNQLVIPDPISRTFFIQSRDRYQSP